MSEVATVSPEVVQETRASIFGSVPPPTPATTQTDNTATDTDAPQNTPPPTQDPWWKAQFGLDSEDAVKQQWQELQTLKTAPPKVEYKEIEFPDEVSRRIYQNIKEGKRAEVKAFLEGQEIVSDLENKTPEQILKLHIKMQNPLFTDKHVDEEYAETYTLDEDSIDADKLERQKLKLEQKKQNDLKQAHEFFSTYKSKIELPEISPKVPQVDADYEEYKTLVTQSEQSQKSLSENLSKITGNQVSYSYQFNDEANKLSVDVSYSPDEKVLNEAKQAAQDIFGYVGKKYTSEDGSPQLTKWISDLAILMDIPKYTAEVAKQAVNAERKRFLSTQKNLPSGTQRSYNVVPDGEKEKAKAQIF